jgi:hypothetical protein
MGDTPFDEVGPLDGMVGHFASAGVGLPPARPGRVLAVSIAGEISSPDAATLAADVEELIHGFVEQRADSAGPTPERTIDTPTISTSDDIAVALHGLALDSELEAELHHTIRAHVRRHLTRREVDG